MHIRIPKRRRIWGMSRAGIVFRLMIVIYREVEKKKMSHFWSIVYFWEMTRFWWNFWWQSAPITSFFCTYFQVHRTNVKKVKTKNAFFHFFKNVKKHIHDTKNSSSQLSALWIFFIFWIRVKTIDSYFFRYSKRDLESNWRF